MNNIVRIFFMFTLLLTAGFAVRANAVSWSPEAVEREEKTAKGIKTVGDIVCLFQSGTADIRKEIHVNDILSVFREDQDHRLTEVGKIKVLSYVGTDYLKGEVVEGELMPGDIARKGDIAGLVISPGDQCKEHKK